jgi:hypothetical protein
MIHIIRMHAAEPEIRLTATLLGIHTQQLIIAF